VQGVFDVNKRSGGLTLTEIAADVSVDEVKAKTGAPLTVSPSLIKMRSA
jgi:3-oxoacid CoA-transferase subunit B